MNKEIKNKPCSSGKFKRLNYYEGMLLTEQDFKDEQNYFREKMKLHNRLHGFGVVWGLEITKKRIKEGNGCTDKFFIEPGFALDCAGNEIIICHPYRLPIDEIIEEFSQGCPPLKEKVCLSISLKYCEGESVPQPQYSSSCEDDELQVKMSRICEGFSVELLPEKETEGCCKQHPDQDCNCKKTYRQDCPGVKECCEDEYGIILGCICIEPEKKQDECEQNQGGETTEQEESVPDANELREAKHNLINSVIKINSLIITIDPCCKPPRVCRPCASPQEKWEHHKQQLIEEACKTSGAIDLTCLIGKSVLEADQFLKEFDVELSDAIPITLLNSEPIEFSLLLKYASSCANKDSKVVLIIDEQKNCVLFAFSLPELNRDSILSVLMRGDSKNEQ